MKVLFDHQIFSNQNYGGISRYFWELIKNTHKNQLHEFELPLFFSNNEYIKDESLIPHSKFLKDFRLRGKGTLIKHLNQIKSSQRLLSGKFDVFHPTYYDDYFLNKIKKKPFVITIYDMIHEKFYDDYPIFQTDKKTLENKKILAEKATKIIAISESTKQDILKFYDINPEKIEVIYLGNSLINYDLSDINIQLPEKYLLFVGNREYYKNFLLFIESISEILLNSNYYLICAGGGSFNSEETELLSKLKIIEKVKLISNFTDNKLSYLYSNATAFAFPSLYEGFGIPVLEALSCNCPAILSNVSSLPEVAGNAAEYFDPTQKKSIYNAVINVIENQTRITELKNLGKERLKMFSWEKTAVETHQLYRNILTTNG